MDFPEIDPDRVTATVASGQEVEEYWRDDDSVEVWAMELRRKEVNFIVSLLLQGASQHAERWTKSNFLTCLKDTEEKILLFRHLFCGRTDVYPIR